MEPLLVENEPDFSNKTKLISFWFFFEVEIFFVWVGLSAKTLGNKLIFLEQKKINVVLTSTEKLLTEEIQKLM